MKIEQKRWTKHLLQYILFSGFLFVILFLVFHLFMMIKPIHSGIQHWFWRQLGRHKTQQIWDREFQQNYQSKEIDVFGKHAQSSKPWYTNILPSACEEIPLYLRISDLLFRPPALASFTYLESVSLIHFLLKCLSLSSVIASSGMLPKPGIWDWMGAATLGGFFDFAAGTW
jgi:hypothetical protein